MNSIKLPTDCGRRHGFDLLHRFCDFRAPLPSRPGTPPAPKPSNLQAAWHTTTAKVRQSGAVWVCLDASCWRDRALLRRPISDLLSLVDHVTPYALHTLHTTHHILHPTPYTLQPTPCTLHPAPCTLPPKTYALHPTPYTHTLHAHHPIFHTPTIPRHPQDPQ